MSDRDEDQKTPPETASDAENAAAVAAAYLDLWQRNIGAWASDPKSGPPLSLIETAARDWLTKPPRSTS